MKFRWADNLLPEKADGRNILEIESTGRSRRDGLLRIGSLGRLRCDDLLGLEDPRTG